MTKLVPGANQVRPIPRRCGTSIDVNSVAHQPNTSLRILRVKDLVSRVGLSRATLYVLMGTDSTFPRKIALTQRTVGFYEHEVDAWLASRAQLSAAA